MLPRAITNIFNIKLLIVGSYYYYQLKHIIIFYIPAYC